MKKQRKKKRVVRKDRKLKFQKRYVGMLLKYFDVQPYTNAVRIRTFKDGSSIEEPFRVANDLPLLAGFAKKIGVHRETVRNWSTQVDEEGKLIHPEFADAYKRAKDSQEVVLVTNGLHGLYSGNSWIFTAKNILKWRDNFDITSGGEKMGDVGKYTYVIPAPDSEPKF